MPQVDQRGAKGTPKGAKGSPKGAKGSQKGAKRKPKGGKRVPKGSQRAIKMPQKSTPEKMSEKNATMLLKMVPFQAILGAKIINKTLFFMIFREFWQFSAKCQFLGAKKRTFWNPFSISGAPKTPPFRASAIAGSPADNLP